MKNSTSPGLSLFSSINTTNIPAVLVSLVLLTLCGTLAAAPSPADDFVTTWKTDNPGTSSSTSITVPMTGGPYEADWDNDGVFDQSFLSGPVTHDFGAADTYTIRIRGTYDSIKFDNGGDKEKIVSLDQWGTNSWTTMSRAFYGAVNLIVKTIDTPDFSLVTDMSHMFRVAASANPNTRGWGTSSVTNMAGMFFGATSANPDTSGWDTSLVAYMGFMFAGATSFNRDIGSWNVTALKDASEMFSGVTLSTTNYQYLLVGWGSQDLQPGVAFSGGNSTYCSVLAAITRASMISSDSWVITDGGQACPQTDDFVTTWKTDNPGTSNSTSITVPMIGGPYEVDWDNDGVFDSSSLVGPITHTFGTVGTYTIRIRGTYDSIRFANGGDKEKILSVDQWGTHSWTTMYGAFWGAVNLIVKAVDTPNFSVVTDMRYMFSIATSANPDTSGWDTSAVTDMGYMFWNATSANPDTSGWDTSAVTNMSFVFSSATLAKPDTSGWDTSKVTDMTGMFLLATSANPDTSGWDTSKVTDMTGMFLRATSANPDTNGWDTSAVTDMGSMFSGAASATPDTSSWDTSMVENMEAMFSGATSANPDTSGWDTSMVESMADMFSGATSANPDTNGWDTSAVTNMNFMFSSATSANPDTSSWDTSKVESMAFMFSSATSANPDTSGWDTSGVTDMEGVFMDATSANPDTSGWDTSEVPNMTSMFAGATSFDRDIGSWDVTALITASGMFSGVTLSTTNYENLLVGWNAQALQPGVAFSGGYSSYCSAAAAVARANMIASDSWFITDGGRACFPVGTCNVNTVSGVTEYFDVTHEACEILAVGPDFIAVDGSNISVNSGREIGFQRGFIVEQGATLNTNICGQSLCMTSDLPMPYGCHTCVDQICDVDPSCCDTEFDQLCLDKVDTLCGLVCK